MVFSKALETRFKQFFPKKKRLPLLLSFVFFLLSLLISIKLLPFAQDDAYIHFRIAENFANFSAPYYNPGQPIMATSSFIWTILLTGLAVIKFPLPITIAILNPLFSVAGAYLWAFSLKNDSDEEKYPFFSYLFQIAYLGLLLPSAFGLMETPLALLILGIGILLISKNKSWGWIFFAVAIFTRYEISIFACLFALVWVLTEKPRKQKWAGFFYFLIPFILISAILMGYYSTILPNSLFAKKTIYIILSSDVFDQAFNSLLPNLSYPFLGIFYFLQSGQKRLFTFLLPYWRPFFYLLTGGSIFGYLIYAKKQHKNYLGGVLFLGGVLLAALYIFQKVLIFDWYFPLFTIPIVFGVYFYVTEFKRNSLARKTENNSQKNKQWLSLPMILLFICLNIKPMINLGMNGYTAFFNLAQCPSAPKGLRVQRYLEVGQVLYKLYPNARLMTSEIGGLGYSFRGEIIDGVGLITPRALTYHPMKVPEQRKNGAIGAIPAAMVGNEMPELIVSYPLYVQEFDSSTFRKEYTKVVVPAFSKTWQGRTGLDTIRGDKEIYLYIRNDIANDQQVNYLYQQLTND